MWPIYFSSVLGVKIGQIKQEVRLMVQKEMTHQADLKISTLFSDLKT